MLYKSTYCILPRQDCNKSKFECNQFPNFIVWIYCGINACFSFMFSQSYKMDASPCGHCLIINNVDFEPQSELNNRTGSNIDCDKLERRFKSLNFIVLVKRNLKQKVRISSATLLYIYSCLT